MSARRLGVVFFGTPDFARPSLEGLARSPHAVRLVVTQPDRPRGRSGQPAPPDLARVAAVLGIPLFQPEEVNAPESVAAISAARPDLLVVVAYGAMLREPLLRLAPLGAVNLHGSLLPRWRGAAPVQHAILAGDGRTGVSVQRMVTRLDAGPVLAARETPIGDRETAGDLFTRLAPLGAQLLVETVDRLAAGEVPGCEQDPSLVTWAPRLAKADGVVDWSRPAREIERFVRAMTPWPGARAVLAVPGGRAVEMTLLAVTHAPEATPEGFAPRAPGDAWCGADVIRVRTGEGDLLVESLQPAGKREVTAHEFLRGRRVLGAARFTGPPVKGGAAGKGVA
ncbi:MAG: methionyl-tRNA formyltransferase [Planctomycetes bacterium]|nr:methionyl-tRNA formyltransferase [Planctomycetota bacterium]